MNSKINKNVRIDLKNQKLMRCICKKKICEYFYYDESADLIQYFYLMYVWNRYRSR